MVMVEGDSLPLAPAASPLPVLIIPRALSVG